MKNKSILKLLSEQLDSQALQHLIGGAGGGTAASGGGRGTPHDLVTPQTNFDRYVVLPPS